MKKIIALSCFSVLILCSCTNNSKIPNSKIEQTTESDVSNNPFNNSAEASSIKDDDDDSIILKWKIRELPAKKSTKYTYQIFLFDSLTNQNHYIETLYVDSSLRFFNGSGGNDYLLDVSVLSLDQQSATGCSIYIEDNMIKAYSYLIGNGIEMDLNLKYSLQIQNKVITEQEEYIDIPEYRRDLKIENPSLFGDDIIYIQALIEGSKIIRPYKTLVDGYYGIITENEVKKIQKKHGLKQTGIVDQETWEKIEQE